MISLVATLIIGTAGWLGYKAGPDLLHLFVCPPAWMVKRLTPEQWNAYNLQCSPGYTTPPPPVIPTPQEITP